MDLAKDLTEATLGLPELHAGDNYTERLEESHADFCLRMEAEGMRVVFPEENELLLDIDSEADYVHMSIAFSVMQRELGPEYGTSLEYKESLSKSGNRHVSIKFPYKLAPWERIAWQGALGSDKFRELYSCIRTLRKHPFPTLFAEKVNGT